MDGGITSKAHSLDVLINRVFKGFFRDLFEEWSLNAPTNPKTGHPLAPSCQLLAQQQSTTKMAMARLSCDADI